MAETKSKGDEVDNRPTSQIDLERRLAEGFRSEQLDNTKDEVLNPEKTYAPYASGDMDTSAYIGVSPEYMTYGGVGSQPFTATEGPEAEALKLLQSGVAGVAKTKEADKSAGEDVGVQSHETIYTATSGSDYSAKLVDAPVEQPGPAAIMPEDQKPAQTPAATPVKSTAPKRN